jgi:hypothetical protein
VERDEVGAEPGLCTLETCEATLLEACELELEPGPLELCALELEPEPPELCPLELEPEAELCPPPELAEELDPPEELPCEPPPLLELPLLELPPPEECCAKVMDESRRTAATQRLESRIKHLVPTERHSADEILETRAGDVLVSFDVAVRLNSTPKSCQRA